MALRAPFLLAAFLSSALLFAVEPLAAKLVLPTFGGAPAVWNGTLLFFQAALLLGYFLAHLSATRLSPRAQRIVQPTFLALSLLTIPLARDTGIQNWVRDRAAEGEAGVWLLLVALAGLVGLPFVALSVNSPLLQRWYAETDAPDAARPTFLYAAGNVGSLLALLSYPLFFEPRFRLGEQAIGWRIGLVALAGLVAVCAFARRSTTAPPPSTAEVAMAEPERTSPIATNLRTQRLRWIALAAVPSALLMGCTTYITSNVAPIPLLWVVPLSLYLLTFVLVYARRPLAPTTFLGRIYPMLVVPLAITILLQADSPIAGMASFHLIVFFVAAWMCHGLLAKEAPEADRLTEYWLWVSLGGALGGVFVAIVAPLVFSSLAEYPIALVGAALLRPEIPRGYAAAKGSLIGRWDDRRVDVGYPLLVAALAAVAVLTLGPSMAPGPQRTFLLLGVPALLAFVAIDRPIRFGLTLGAAFLVPTMLGAASNGAVLLTERSFFGVHRVLKMPAVGYVGYDGEHRSFGPFMELVHGNTVHGKQDLSHPSTPLTYYHPTGPIGKLMQSYAPPRVALVGLGVGSLAAYGQPGQAFDYFEIDPVVARIARDPRYFTFLKDSAAKVRIVLGDARLTLSRQSPGYGLIVLDAFTSDSIPVHLLTVECLRMAISKLTPNGILAIHVSNRYLDLEPVLAANANVLGIAILGQIDGPTPDDDAAGKTQSHWILMARRMSDLAPYKGVDWNTIDPDPSMPPARPWTDDYSNVLGAFNPQQ